MTHRIFFKNVRTRPILLLPSMTTISTHRIFFKNVKTVELPYMAHSAHVGMTALVGGNGELDMSALNDGSEWQWPA